MGLIINRTAIIVSTITAVSLLAGLDAFLSFLLAFLIYVPLKMFLPGDKKIQTVTAIFSAAGTIFSSFYLGYSLLYSVLAGILFGYGYTYWVNFGYPRIFLKTKKNSVNNIY